MSRTIVATDLQTYKCRRLRCKQILFGQLFITLVSRLTPYSKDFRPITRGVLPPWQMQETIRIQNLRLYRRPFRDLKGPRRRAIGIAIDHL